MYLAQLAYAMQVAEHQLAQIAKKFHQIFEMLTDDYNQVNIRLKRGKRKWGADETLSRNLSSLLRHQGGNEGFNFMPGQFTRLLN